MPLFYHRQWGRTRYLRNLFLPCKRHLHRALNQAHVQQRQELARQYNLETG